MTGIHHFETFLLAGILLNLTPGNDTIFILSRSIAQGRKAGILSVMGIATGSLVHTAMAAFGLSLILARSPLAFNIVKYCGAAYLLYIGIRMLMASRLVFTEEPTTGRINHFRIYRDAVLTNVLNPKVALFFISFLPQFIDPSYHRPAIPFLLLGLTFTITGTLWCLVLAAFASFIASKLKSGRKLSVYVNRVCGVAIIALGLRMVFTRR